MVLIVTSVLKNLYSFFFVSDKENVARRTWELYQCIWSSKTDCKIWSCKDVARCWILDQQRKAHFFFLLFLISIGSSVTANCWYSISVSHYPSWPGKVPENKRVFKTCVWTQMILWLVSDHTRIRPGFSQSGFGAWTRTLRFLSAYCDHELLCLGC